VVEGAALEKRCAVFPYREFESPSLRQEKASHVYYMAGFLFYVSISPVGCLAMTAR
jgi:hypothetical protein